MTSFGRLELSKKHPLCSGTDRFAISEKVRGLCCLTGQAVPYEQGSELLLKLGNISMSAMQIQRQCKYYGSLLDPLIQADCEAVIPKLKETKSAEPVYVMVDGAMLCLEEGKWKELKLGRIFSGDNVVQLSDRRRQARQSIYVGHLGSVDEFFPKLERHLVDYSHKVIIGDGARWIWNWAEDNYPGAIQILDFFHAKEKLVLFARNQWKEEKRRREWVENQLEKLRHNGVYDVIQAVQSCRPSNEEAKSTKAKLINYYEEHSERMQYKTYRDRGLLIGSGPIEAAHRSVIQQRMKLSGQKWSTDGAQSMVNLRCYYASQAWDMVEKIIKAA